MRELFQSNAEEEPSIHKRATPQWQREGGYHAILQTPRCVVLQIPGCVVISRFTGVGVASHGRLVDGIDGTARLGSDLGFPIVEYLS